MADLFSPTNMTSGTAPSPYIVTESDYTTRQGYHAFKLTESWNCNTLPAWVTLYLGSTKGYKLTDYSVKILTDVTDAPEDWTVAGSTNGTDWTTLDTQAGISFTSGEEKDFEISLPENYYTYFRLNTTAFASGGRQDIVLIKYYGYVDPEDTRRLITAPKKTNFYNPFPILGGV